MYFCAQMAKKTASETPLMKQHREIKSKYPDAILLFRVGDFYETFAQDAVVAAQVLGITLTRRANGSAAFIELAGFPHHALDTYLHKLVKAGYRVAICDQLEDPKTVKGIVKRGVTELVTPGVATNDRLLENKSNNFLAALHLDEKENGVAFLDISTGECFVAQGNLEYVDKLLQSFQPSEVLVAKGKQRFFKAEMGGSHYTYPLEDWIFQHHYGYETLIRHFDTRTLKGYGIEDWQAATIAAGAVFHYLKETEHPHLQHISQLQRIHPHDFLWMDRFTIRNLELLQSPVENGFTLLQSIDRTFTAMGARLLKRWLVFPLCDLGQINNRQAAVQAFLNETALYEKMQPHLKSMGDIERLVSKIPLKKINPRELLQLARSIEHTEQIETLCKGAESEPVHDLVGSMINTSEVKLLIQKNIAEEAPVLLHKGGVIQEGVHEELDALRAIAYRGKEYLAKIQAEESRNTGIPSLKIAFNNVFGYYIEVTNTHKDKVPAHWLRKQTLANAERYITPELKEYEEKVLGAEEKIAALERQLYEQLLDRLQLFLQPLQVNAQVMASIDCLYAFASAALAHHYVRPQLVSEHILDIKQGRHPVIEQHLPVGEQYIANDIFLDQETQQIIILTGPNMSGKSALLRQTALIALMAHMGSFVPAQEAVIGLTDKIFTRVGASDNLSGGESTFMVEMTETASIVNNLSARSLVLLDEIGRGTSTYDGISIAWSLVEHLHQSKQRPKTLFATHYHELNELESKLDRVKNFHITHKETSNRIIFLRKMEAGGSRHSFGIQVAKMAGMPATLTERAEEVLSVLEEKNKENNMGKKVKKLSMDTFQLNIFDGLSTDLTRIKEVLFATDINTLTPVEALLKLNELKNIIKTYQEQ